MYLSTQKIISTDANVFINKLLSRNSWGADSSIGQKSCCEEYAPHTAKCILGGVFFTKSKLFLKQNWSSLTSNAGFEQFSFSTTPGEGWVLPYIGYTGMCRWRRYGFQAIWSGRGSRIIENWSSIGSRLTGSLTQD